MKTFKIVALQVIDESERMDIPLTDGLIINKENEDGSWVIEAYIDQEHENFFNGKKEQEKEFEIRVVITHEGNEPAPFTVTVHSVKNMDSHISVLLKGKLSKRRIDYVETLLEDLIDKGLNGDQLVSEFKKKLSGKR